jgi:hypothetical protein
MPITLLPEVWPRMPDFKVPTVQLSTEIQCVDGTVLRGTVFMPALSAVQAGPMGPEEWINGPLMFFPFRPEGGGRPVLVNKRSVLALGVTPAAIDEEQVWEPGLLVRRVVVEAGGTRFEGEVAIDMPENQRRLVDYLNCPEAFLPLRTGERLHLVRKDCISRVAEIPET